MYIYIYIYIYNPWESAADGGPSARIASGRSLYDEDPSYLLRSFGSSFPGICPDLGGFHPLKIRS